MTSNEFKILLYLKSNPREEHFGLSIVRATKLVSGTVYAALIRMENEGLVSSTSENIDPSKEGRPARKFYAITAKGITSLEQEIKSMNLINILGGLHA